MQLNDAKRRGLRTGIDVALAALSSGAVLLLINIFKEPDLTVEQFTVVTLAITPIITAIKNALEDKAGSSFLVSKVRPEPDPVEPDSTTVQPSEGEVFGDAEGLDEQMFFGTVPPGMVLVAVDASEVEESDIVVGYTR